jgi:hypothetical protein
VRQPHPIGSIVRVDYPNEDGFTATRFHYLVTGHETLADGRVAAALEPVRSEEIPLSESRCRRGVRYGQSATF